MRRAIASAFALAIAVSFVPLLSAPAQATTPPVAFNSDDLPTWQTNGIAWAVAEANGLVFVAGAPLVS